MGKALYRKYRSKSLGEVVGQEHVTKTLQNAIKSGKISHAYLFTGPRGVGKTSIARIMAHEVNQLTYDENAAAHLDIIEIDAASNRRIDEIRDLRDKVHISPTSAKYKVYIIDEVHMLTKEAFNALLKTLEEPPEHVIFILATTEAHKLPETIVSRTQRYTFKPITIDATVDHLRTIAKAEKLDINDEALKLIAEHGDGSMRDSISLLDQAASNQKKVTVDDVRRMLGVVPEEALTRLIETLSDGAPNDLLETLRGLREQGFQAASVAKQLGQLLRDQLINGVASLPLDTTTALLRSLLQVPSSSNPERILEVILLEVVLSNDPVTELPQPKPAARVAEPLKVEIPAPKPAQPEQSQEPEKINEIKPTAAHKKTSGPFIISAWPEVLGLLKKRHSTLYGVLRMSVPSYENDTLILAFQFPFHKKQMESAQNREKLLATISELTGLPGNIDCVVNTDNQMVEPIQSPETAHKNDEIRAISNIFGGAEVLES